MTTFSEAVETACRFISEKKMLKDGDCVVVGVSGGADSVLLLNVLLAMTERLELRLVVAHLNHGLRLEAADELAFVRQLCREHGVSFHAAVISPGVLARTAGSSIEMAARARRKQFLNAVADATGASKIALGHTGSDHVETVLMNIHRGTGLRGLTGIHFAGDKIIRPLISLSGLDIRRVLTENGIKFIEDKSNKSPEFLRNRVRCEIMPSLIEVFGSEFHRKWRRLSENTADSISALKTLLEYFLARRIKQDESGFRVDKNLLRTVSEPLLKEIILFLLEKASGSTYFMTTKRLKQLAVFVHGSGYGEVAVHPGIGVHVVRSGQWLYFLRKLPGVDLEIEKTGKYDSWFQERLLFCREDSEEMASTDASVLFLDENRFSFPFRFAPVDFEKDHLFSKGRKLRNIGDFMKKRGLGKLERERMPVLKKGPRILWIPGIVRLVTEGETEMQENRIAVYFTDDMR